MASLHGIQPQYLLLMLALPPHALLQAAVQPHEPAVLAHLVSLLGCWGCESCALSCDPRLTCRHVLTCPVTLLLGVQAAVQPHESPVLAHLAAVQPHLVSRNCCVAPGVGTPCMLKQSPAAVQFIKPVLCQTCRLRPLPCACRPQYSPTSPQYSPTS